MSNQYNFKYYAIITGSRTGSSHLCDLLESTNRLGKPDEYFNIEMMPYYLKNILPQTNQSYVDKLTWSTKKSNFVVGIKLNHVNHIYELDQHNMIEKIGYWVWLIRDDKVMQAISRYKAWQTDVWDWTQTNENKNPNLKYDKVKIKAAYDSVIEEERWIGLFLKDKNYMEVYYEEDLTKNPEQTVISILNFIGVPTEDLPVLKSQQKVMRDQQSLAWKAQFIKDFPGLTQ